MNTHEIRIYDFSPEHDLDRLLDCLQSAAIRGEDRDGVGMYRQNDKAYSVFVEPSELGRAVKVLNQWGFQTDEDELTDEDGDMNDADDARFYTQRDTR